MLQIEKQRRENKIVGQQFGRTIRFNFCGEFHLDLISWQIDENKKHKSTYVRIILDFLENNVTKCIVYIENKLT